MSEVQTFLSEHGASPELREVGAQYRSLISLWNKCPRADWMLWIVQQLHHTNRNDLRIFACSCARHLWDLLQDPRSRKAVEVAEAFTKGDAPRADLNIAQQAAIRAARELTIAGEGPAAWAAWVACATTMWPSFEAAKHAMNRTQLASKGLAPGVTGRNVIDQQVMAERMRDIIANPFVLTRAECDPRERPLAMRLNV